MHPLTTDTYCLSFSSPLHWEYVAEGGATIVLSYIGPPHAQLTGNVLRLRKRLKDTKAIKLSASGVDSESLGNRLIVFHQTVIERLVPAEFLVPMRSVRVERAWLAQLKELCEKKRPHARTAKDEIDLETDKAIIVPNLVGNDGWAVEIKPKWGFLPSHTFLSPSTSQVKRGTCRFCMHSYMRSARSQSPALTFCPLDLYSGKEERIRCALQALWDDWLASSGTINNLRVFANGKLVEPTEPHSLNILAQKLSNKIHNVPLVSATKLRDYFVDTLLPLLVNTSVLRTLSSLQRSLDPLDIEGLAALWDRSHPQSPSPMFGEGEPEPTQDEWAHFVEEYLSRTASMADVGQLKPRPGELRYYCLAYLLSATFKDCSIMITMPPPVEGGGTTQPSIKIIDLDAKSVSRLSKWQKLDQEIVATYASVDLPRVCVDPWQG